jgi:flagellar basal body L-ring protein FlgH
MRLRALALALALSFGLTAGMEAKQKPAVQRAKIAKTRKKAWKPGKKSKAYKQSKAAKVKPRKAPKHRAV